MTPINSCIFCHKNNTEIKYIIDEEKKRKYIMICKTCGTWGSVDLFKMIEQWDKHKRFVFDVSQGNGDF